jgi:hypothetical protein
VRLKLYKLILLGKLYNLKSMKIYGNNNNNK